MIKTGEIYSNPRGDRYLHIGPKVSKYPNSYHYVINDKPSYTFKNLDNLPSATPHALQSFFTHNSYNLYRGDRRKHKVEGNLFNIDEL